MSIVSIKEVKGVVTCGDDGRAAHVFNVKNSMGTRIRIAAQLAADEPVQAAWLALEGESERDLDPDTVTQFVVNIQVPGDCKPGKYSYRLRVFDPDNPGEKFVDGESVYFEVVEKKKVVVPDDDNKKRWIPYVVAAVVLVVIIGVAIKMLTGKTEVEVPDLKTLTLFDALQKISARELTFNAETGLSSRRVSDPGQVGRVVDQKPAATAKVPEKTEVQLWVGASSKFKLEDMISGQNMIKLKTMKHVTIPQSMLTRSIEPQPEND